MLISYPSVLNMVNPDVRNLIPKSEVLHRIQKGEFPESLRIEGWPASAPLSL